MIVIGGRRSIMMAAFGDLTQHVYTVITTRIPY